MNFEFRFVLGSPIFHYLYTPEISSFSFVHATLLTIPVIMRLLSAPKLRVTIQLRSTLLLETKIENAITKKVERGVYIPPNMERGVRVSFYINNFDEHVKKLTGKAQYTAFWFVSRKEWMHSSPLNLTSRKQLL